ncbi:MAG: GPW/gp25 family protein [Bacteroidales bacterium]|nr:GPW/gp25 family protein [Bacteroidales bacterium]
MDQNKSFLGSGWSFPPSFNIENKSVKMLQGESDIESSLEILLTTGIGERFLQPEYGCDLRDVLFSPVNVSESYVKDLIKDAILYYEPRVELNDVKIEPENENGKVTITLYYTVLATNTRYNMVYPFYKEEGTEL